MAILTARLKHRIQRDFPVGTADEVARHLTALTATAFGGQDQERVMAAIVLASAGQWGRFRAVIRLAIADWRCPGGRKACRRRLARPAGCETSEDLPHGTAPYQRDSRLPFRERLLSMKIARMRIPVFVSAPSPDNLSPAQEASAEIIHRLVRRYKLEWRALGRSDYPNDLPLREVLRMVRHCSGGIILGFEQFAAPAGEFKVGSKNPSKATNVSFPTPWNQLEAGILFSAGLPMMIFREPDIRGGIFDIGSSEVYIHQIPTSKMKRETLDDLDSVFQIWVAKVRAHYYGD
jgi:hypothetical protein